MGPLPMKPALSPCPTERRQVLRESLYTDCTARHTARFRCQRAYLQIVPNLLFQVFSKEDIFLNCKSSHVSHLPKMLKLLLFVLKIKFKLPVVVESLAQSSEDLPDPSPVGPLLLPHCPPSSLLFAFVRLPPTLGPWPRVGKGRVPGRGNQLCEALLIWRLGNSLPQGGFL